MPKTAAMKVPGRNTIVKAAIVFIDELSLLASRAIFADSVAIVAFVWLSC